MNDPRLIDYYRARAPEYERVYYRDNPSRRQELVDEGERLQPLVAGKTVLDPACGTGYWLDGMSGSAAAIAAMDIALEMISEARKKTYGCPVDFVRGDIYESPFARACFDIVTLGFWLSHHPLETLDVLFDCITFPLTSGGRIWMIDNNPPAERPDFQVAFKDEHGNSYIRRHLMDGTTHLIMKNYYDEARLRAIFSRRFVIDRLTFGEYYWSVVLAPR